MMILSSESENGSDTGGLGSLLTWGKSGCLPSFISEEWGR